MYDRLALLESALDSLPDGIAVFDHEGRPVFWNQAAAAITGYAAAEVESQIPAGLAQLGAGEAGRGVLAHTRHKLGHEIPAIARKYALRDELGAVVVFHPAARLDALPHGEAGDDEGVKASQEDFEERLRAEYEDFERGGQPMGVLWIGVDQGPELRRTHGAGAWAAMLEKVRRALAGGLRPAEELARWGEDEFLIIAHERSAEMLASHAHVLAGLARTADFRWWGDRISLTVSIGASQACAHESCGLTGLLKSARQAMEASSREGGNRVTCAQRPRSDGNDGAEELACMPS